MIFNQVKHDAACSKLIFPCEKQWSIHCRSLDWFHWDLAPVSQVGCTFITIHNT